MNRPEKATRSHGKPSDDDDETTGLGLPVSLKRQIESYAVMHHMTPTQVLAEGMKLLLKQEALQQGRMNRTKPKARPCNKPFDAEERQYLCGLDAVDECGEKRITWNRYFIRYVEYELELGALRSTTRGRVEIKQQARSTSRRKSEIHHSGQQRFRILTLTDQTGAQQGNAERDPFGRAHRDSRHVIYVQAGKVRRDRLHGTGMQRRPIRQRRPAEQG